MPWLSCSVLPPTQRPEGFSLLVIQAVWLASCFPACRDFATEMPTHSRVFGPTAHVPLFLYPFLNTTSKTRPFEYLRLTSLGVIGALVKVCHPSCSCEVRASLHSHTSVAAAPLRQLLGSTSNLQGFSQAC